MDVITSLTEVIPIFYLGVFASLAAGLATGVGGLPILFTTSISQRAQDTMLGFGAGVMLAATSFSLIIPGIDAATAGGGTTTYAAFVMVGGIMLGGFFLFLGDRYLPHEHFIKGREGLDTYKLRRVWLFILAITLHNFPEGMAVGVGFGTGNVHDGLVLAIGIGLQNIPEGLVVAMALVSHNYTKGYALWIALLSGLVEPVGGALGAGIIQISRPLLPWGLAFAAGAMLYVISNEIIPESHRKGYEREATFGVLIGFVVMMFLDVTLGG
ncbi:MAG: ZIP family metal transporter [Candidatus Marinimicrobia bacterium]|nr:ZIP family metal transporter [Candidatus Neomarinimicrobiota bacterium]MCF7829843.1 ZIP family metal transporter [Candidatus Neomarinimicrobiota bacterium]MCF7882471.1 ZIP family metal transporter [Candidatus Neomarinimicrobiota bacterium]